MGGTAPNYDNLRYGGPDGIRYPAELGKSTFVVQPDAGNTTAQIIVGAFNATTAGSGIPLSGTRTFVERGNADDGGKQLATGQAYLFGSRRFLMSVAQSGNISAFGGNDRLSIAGDESGITGVTGGSWGMLELKSGGKTQGNTAGCGAVRADLNLQSGGTVSSGGIVSAFLAASEAISATKTGKVVVLHVTNPGAGAYDAFAEIASASGCIDAHTAGSTTSGKQILITIDGSPFAIPVAAVGT